MPLRFNLVTDIQYSGKDIVLELVTDAYTGGIHTSGGAR